MVSRTAKFKRRWQSKKKNKNPLQLPYAPQVCCDLNQDIMIRMAEHESKQAETESKLAQLVTSYQDLTIQMTQLNGAFADMIENFRKELGERSCSQCSHAASSNRQLEGSKSYTNFNWDFDTEDDSEFEDKEAEFEEIDVNSNISNGVEETADIEKERRDGDDIRAISLGCAVSNEIKIDVGNEDKGGDIEHEGSYSIDLTSDIIFEILSTLPVVTVMKFKLACKKWNAFLSTTEFAKLHLSKSNPCLIVLQTKGHSKKRTQSCRLFKFGDENGGYLLGSFQKIKFSLSIIPGRGKVNATAYFLGSVNGLVCFCRSLSDTDKIVVGCLYVCNSVTREYIMLPIVKDFVESPDVVAYGFGATTHSDQYKAVIIYQWIEYDDRIYLCFEYEDTTDEYVQIRNSEFSVYTLGTGSLRSVGGVSTVYRYTTDENAVGIFFNGNLHWLVKELKCSKLVSCFDLEKELFWTFPIPAGDEQSYFRLGVIEGCLCLCQFRYLDSPDVIVWMMKEYGAKNSWTKEFVISNKTDPHYKCYRVDDDDDDDDTDEKNDHIASSLVDNHFFLGSILSKPMQTVPRVIDCHQSMFYTPSFLSLKDFGSEKVRRF